VVVRSPTSLRRNLALTALFGTTACAELATDPIDNVAFMPSFALVGSAFTDEFLALDAQRWTKSTHMLGRGLLDPANVVTQHGRVDLFTRPAAHTGAEIHTRELYGTGTFVARARCAVPAGAVCAFFMYQTGVGNRADEIDIELLGGTRTIWFTTWVNGRRTNHREVTLGFDPAAGFHEYLIARSTNEIRFYVDGAQLATFQKKQRLPQANMPVFANAWWPTWLTPTAATGAWELESIAVF
jgi:beta-glucanase (GH16 family)